MNGLTGCRRIFQNKILEIFESHFVEYKKPCKKHNCSRSSVRAKYTHMKEKFSPSILTPHLRPTSTRIPFKKIKIELETNSCFLIQ